MSQIKIGWASRDVSTSAPLNIPGQFYMRISKGVMDPVTVTALAVENGGQRVVFVSGDMIDCRHGLLDEVRERVGEKGLDLDPTEILMAVTHTHTGPSHLNGLGAISIPTDEPFPHDGVEIGSAEEYRHFLALQIADAVAEAWRCRSAGGIAYGYGFAVVGFNRRVAFFDDLSLRPDAINNSTHGVNGHVKMYGNTADPQFSHYEGGMDPFVNLMFTFDGDKKLTGAVVNVPCPSQNSETEEYLSADFWYDVRLAIREKYGDIFLLPQCAAAGDLSPRQLHYKKAQERRFRLKYGEIDTVAERKLMMANRRDIAQRIADAFDEVYGWAKKEIFTEAKVLHRVKTLQLPKRLISPEARREAEKGYASECEAAFSFEGTPAENLKHNSSVMSRRGRYRKILEKYEAQQKEPFVPMELHTVRIGEIAFCSNQFELFLDYQHRIQARSPFLQTFVVQLAAQPGRDNATYLPTERAVEGRGFGASIYDNIVTPEAGQILVEETLKELEIISE